MNPIWPTWLKVSYVVVCVIGMFAVMTGLAWLITPSAETFGAWAGERLGIWPLVGIFPLWYLAYRWNR